MKKADWKQGTDWRERVHAYSPIPPWYLKDLGWPVSPKHKRTAQCPWDSPHEILFPPESIFMRSLNSEYIIKLGFYLLFNEQKVCVECLPGYGNRQEPLLPWIPDTGLYYMRRKEICGRAGPSQWRETPTVFNLFFFLSPM